MAMMIIEGSGTGGAEPRRRFSDDDKARIVSEAMMPGASVSDVARRYRVCSSLVSRWRRVLLRDGVPVEAPRLRRRRRSCRWRWRARVPLLSRSPLDREWSR
ncbi:transposase [Sphingomonas sp. PAMC 26617]|uniref:transposase n=1 Tax=Sphingomonas sp. PAMC 26617 TaxID=1112216 RepID=UPI0009DA218D